MSKSTKAQYNNPELYGVSLSPHSPRRLRLQQVKRHTAAAAAAAVDQAESFISSQETSIPSSSSTTTSQLTARTDSTRSNELHSSLHPNNCQGLNPHPNSAPHSRVPSSCYSCVPHSSSSQTTSFTPTLRHSSSTFFSNGSDAEVSDHGITKFSAATAIAAAAGIKTDLSSSIDCEYQYQVMMDDVSMTGNNDETVVHDESVHLEGGDDEWSQESIRYQQSNYGYTESDNESEIVNLSRSASIEQGEQEQQSEIDRCDVTSLSSGMTDGVSMCLTTTGRNRHARVGRSLFHSYYNNDNNHDGGANDDHHNEDSTTTNIIQPDHNNDSVVHRQALGGCSDSLRAWRAQSSSPSSSMDVEEPFIDGREKGRSSCCCYTLQERGQEENNCNNQLNVWEIQPNQILLSRQQQHDSPLEQGLQLCINNQAAGNHQSSNSSRDARHIIDTHSYVGLGLGCHNQQQPVNRSSRNINTMNNVNERSRSPEQQGIQMGNSATATTTTPAAAAEFDHPHNSSSITSDQFRTASATELLTQSAAAAAAVTVDGVAAEAEELVGSFFQSLQRETQHEFFGTRSFLQHLNILRLERQSQRRQSNNRWDVQLQDFGSSSIPDLVTSTNTPYSPNACPNASPNGNGQSDRVQEDTQHRIRHHYRTVINPSQPVRAGGHSDDVPMRSVSAAEMNTNHISHRSRLQPAAFHSRDPHNNNDGRFHAATQTLPTFDRERILGLLQLRSQVVAQLDSRQSAGAAAAAAAANASSNEMYSATEYMNRVSGDQQNLMDASGGQQQQTRGTAVEYAAAATGGVGQPSRLDRKALLEQMRGPLHKSIISKIDHSSKFTDDVYEYRFVILPRYHPWFGLDIEEHLRESLMDEEEWRLLGIGHTRGWEHYGYSRHESNVFLFRRALGTDPKTGKLNCLHKTKVNERMKLLETLSKELEESRRSTAQFADGPTSFCCQRRRKESNQETRKRSISDITCSSSINANGAASNPLVSTVSGFGSFQGGSMIDYASLIQQPSLHGNAGADRVNASTLTARHLAAVIRTGEVYPQPPMPFFDLPYTEDEEKDSEGLWHSNGDDKSVCTDCVDDNEEHNEREGVAVGGSGGVSSTAECFLNDVDWLYASLHMPLYPTS